MLSPLPAETAELSRAKRPADPAHAAGQGRPVRVARFQLFAVAGDQKQAIIRPRAEDQNNGEDLTDVDQANAGNERDQSQDLHRHPGGHADGYQRDQCQQRRAVNKEQNDDDENDRGGGGVVEAGSAGGDQVTADPARAGHVQARGNRARRGHERANGGLSPIHGVAGLRRHVWHAERHLDQHALLVGADQAAADQRLPVRDDAGDLQTGRVLHQGRQRGGHSIDEGEIVLRQGAVGALDGKDRTAGEHVLREGFFEQQVPAHAGVPGREEADVIVLGLVPPIRRDQG